MPSQPEAMDGARLALPISIKGILWRADRVCLLHNERDEWELPGGKLEPGETPAITLVREIGEELGLQATVGPLVAAWVYDIKPGVAVFVVAYMCSAADDGEARMSGEHSGLGWFSLDDLAGLSLPDGYRQAILASKSVPR